MLNSLAMRVRAFLVEDDGRTATEYAILLALIIAVVVVSIQSMGLSARRIFGQIWDAPDPIVDSDGGRNGAGRF